MTIDFGTPQDIESWMKLVRKVSWNFPGLETEEEILEHEKTVLKFMRQNRAICAKENGEVVGVLLFSRKYNLQSTLLYGRRPRTPQTTYCIGNV